jgi:hypothetical protein
MLLITGTKTKKISYTLHPNKEDAWKLDEKEMERF